jgi:lysophospholipase L1-like esterase
MNKVLIFGDSIVFGRGVKKNQSWPSLLMHHFDRIDNKDTIIFNLGIPGETSDSLLRRFDHECSVRIKPQDNPQTTTIIIATGLNDAKSLNQPQNYQTRLSSFEQNLIKIIKLGQKYTQNIILVGCTKIYEDKAGFNRIFFLNRNIQIFNKSIKKIALNNRLQYVPIFEEWSSADIQPLLTNDGIHPNEKGHKKIYKSLISHAKINFFNPFYVLKNEISLSWQDISAIKETFIENKLFESDLVMGQFYNQKAQAIVGAPCIRNDIREISLNTFYQIFLPLKMASVHKIPAVIFLGIQEEILQKPNLTKKYQTLSQKLSFAIQNMANELKIVDLKIIDTSLVENNSIIRQATRELNIKLSAKESSNLYNLSIKPRQNYVHPPLRVASNQRMVTCNTAYAISKLLKENFSFLIVEDIEQYKCTQFARKFDHLEPPNFLAFLPLPNIYGTKTMFKSERGERLLIGKKDSYYAKLFKKIEPGILIVYAKLFSIIEDQDAAIYNNYPDFLRVIRKISRYFLI